MSNTSWTLGYIKCSVFYLVHNFLLVMAHSSRCPIFLCMSLAEWKTSAPMIVILIRSAKMVGECFQSSKLYTHESLKIVSYLESNSELPSKAKTSKLLQRYAL